MMGVRATLRNVSLNVARSVANATANRTAPAWRIGVFAMKLHTPFWKARRAKAGPQAAEDGWFSRGVRKIFRKRQAQTFVSLPILADGEARS